MGNRAKEFLLEALGLMKYGKYAQAQTVVYHALQEVYELEQLAAQAESEPTMAPPKPDSNAGPVLVVEAQRMTPALLAESPRAALPGNGKGL